jgi:hypothetical protein
MTRQQFDVRRELARVREERDEILATRTAVERAPVSRDEAVARIEERIAERLATVFAPNVANFGSARYDARYAGTLFNGEVDALFVWWDGPGIRDRLMAELDDWYRTQATALSAAERTSELAALDHRVSELEVTEEGLIREAEEVGIMLERRGNADPGIVLARDLSNLSVSEMANNQ